MSQLRQVSRSADRRRRVRSAALSCVALLAIGGVGDANATLRGPTGRKRPPQTSDACRPPDHRALAIQGEEGVFRATLAVAANAAGRVEAQVTTPRGAIVLMSTEGGWVRHVGQLVDLSDSFAGGTGSSGRIPVQPQMTRTGVHLGQISIGDSLWTRAILLKAYPRRRQVVLAIKDTRVGTEERIFRLKIMMGARESTVRMGGHLAPKGVLLPGVLISQDPNSLEGPKGLDVFGEGDLAKRLGIGLEVVRFDPQP